MAGGRSMRRTGSFALVGLLAWASPAHAEGAQAGQIPELVRRAESQQAQGRYADSLKTLADAEAEMGQEYPLMRVCGGCQCPIGRGRDGIISPHAQASL